MEAVAKEFAAGHIQDISNRPWYIRWGIAVLGLIAGLLLILTSLTDTIGLNLVGIVELGTGVLLIAFEATLIAKAFSFEFCGVLINLSEKCTPLMRGVLYAGLCLLILLMGTFAKIFILIPVIATSAAYIYLWMEARKEADAGAASPTDFA